MAALALPVGTDALATAAMAEGGGARAAPAMPEGAGALALWLCPSWPRTAALGPRLAWTCPPWSLKVLWLLQFNSIAEIDDLAMICKVLFLRYRAAVAARPVCMPAAAAAAYRCARAGVGSGRTPGLCLPAKRGQRLAWLPARGGGGRRAASLPARQGQRQRQACPSDGGGGPGYPVNAPAGCNLCTRAKATYYTINT